MKQQSADSTSSDQEDSSRQNSLATPLTHMASDQMEIWTSPAKLRPADAAWFVPVAGVAAGLFATDRSFSRSLSNSPSRLNNSVSVSNYGVASLGAAAGGLYLWGKAKHSGHMTETAILSGEAALNSLLVVETLKYAAGRDRPNEGGGGGRFFQGGTSFPSEHSTAAWSIAGVVAHEYPGPLTSLFAYGLATTVSLARVTAKQHFPSDVFAGAVLGWWIAKQSYRTHHDPNLGGKSWETYRETHETDARRRPARLGSPFVPLESWVYQAFERLATLGYVSVANFAIKPWSRMECAQMLLEAVDRMHAAARGEAAGDPRALPLETALREEFARELAAIESGPNQSLSLESVYGRVTSISGPPVTDGYHFGQTISYDYGRPYERGANAVAGVEFSGTSGPFAFFIQPEYQHSPFAPPLPLSAREAIAGADNLPLQPPTPFSEINHFELLQGYVSYSFLNFQLSAGRQTLSWGPSVDGPLMFGLNARPFPMLRLTQTKAPDLPGLLKYIFPARIDTIFGRLDGHSVFPRPFIFGQKYTIEWGHNFEFSYAHTSIISGEGGDPLNFTSFGEILFGLHCTIPSCATKGAPPGESNTQSDIILRVPYTHGAALLYLDLYSEDDAFPMRAMSESIYRPGLYISRFRGLPRLDLRLEMANSETPFLRDQGENGVSYSDNRYTNGFTNAGNLMGNTVGRQGQTYQVTSTYWFSPQSSLAAFYRNNSVDPKFIAQGGKWQDYGLSLKLLHHSGLSINGVFQYEHVSRYPVLFPGAVNNVTASLEVGYRPRGGLDLLKVGHAHFLERAKANSSEE